MTVKWLTTQNLVQVFEEPQKKQLLYWVATIVLTLFLLYSLIKWTAQ